MQRVEIPDIVLASQEQVQKVAARQGGGGGNQGGGREDPAAGLRRRDPAAQGAARQEPEERRRLVLPRAQLRRQADVPGGHRCADEGHGAEPRVPGAPLRAGRLSSATPRHARRPRGLREEPGDRAYPRRQRLQRRLDPLRHGPDSTTPWRASSRAWPRNRRTPTSCEMAGRCYIHQAKLAQAVESFEKARAATHGRGQDRLPRRADREAQGGRCQLMEPRVYGLRRVLLLAVALASAALRRRPSVVDTTPGHEVNSFVPKPALGAGIDRMSLGRHRQAVYPASRSRRCSDGRLADGVVSAEHRAARRGLALESPGHVERPEREGLLHRQRDTGRADPALVRLLPSAPRRHAQRRDGDAKATRA